MIRTWSLSAAVLAVLALLAMRAFALPLYPADVAASLNFLGPAGERLAAALQLQARLDEGGALLLELELPEVELELDGVQGRLAGRATVRQTDDGWLLSGVRLESGEATLVLGERTLRLPPLNASVDQARIAEDGEFKVSDLILEIPGLADLQGGLERNASGSRVELAGDITDLARLKPILAGLGVELPEQVSPSGPAKVDLALTMAPDGALSLHHLKLQLREASLGPLEITARGRLTPKLELNAAITGPLSAAARLRDTDQGLEVTVQDMNLDLGRAVPVLLTQLGGERDGWLAEGRLRGSGRLLLGEAPTGELELAVGGGAIVSPGGRLLTQGVDATLAASLGAETVTMNLSAPQGELLYDTFYLGLNGTPLTATLSATRATTGWPEALEGLKLRVAAKGLGRLAASGTVSIGQAEPAYRLQVNANRLNLRQLAKTAGLGLDIQGQAAFAGQASGRGERLDLDGRLTVADGAYAPLVPDMELDLPVRYRFGREPTPQEPRQWGSLKVKGLSLPLTNAPVDVDLPVALVPNRLLVNAPLDLPLAGGLVTVDSIAVEAPLSADPEITAAVVVDGLDLAELGTSDIPVSGSISGKLPQVRLTKKRLTTNGGLTGDVFGGKLSLRNLGVERPLDTGRTLLAEADVRLMDLEEFSQALGIGKVTGRMSLTLSDLAVAFGQPVGFSLRAWSVPVDGVSQDISLRAINTLTVLGTGSGLGDAGVGFFASLLKTFPYKAMGLLCLLNNDLFTVRGLIREGGVEYIVKKPLFFGVNVVNGTPSNRIRFGDMLERLSRVLSQGQPGQSAQPADQTPSGSSQ